MNYLNKEDIKGILSDRDFADLTDGSDDAVLDVVGKQAEAEIEGFMRGRYTLPLQQPIDLMVINILLDVFKFRLYQRRRPERITDDIIKMYDRAIARLKDMQGGKLLIDNEKLIVDKNKTNEGNLKVLENGRQKFRAGFTNN